MGRGRDTPHVSSAARFCQNIDRDHLLIAWYVPRVTFDGWTLAVAVVASLTNIVIFAALLWQLQLLQRQLRQTHEVTVLDHDRRRKQATIEFYATTLGEQRRMRETLPHDRNKAALQPFIDRAISGDEDINKAIVAYLSLHNLIAISVRSDVFDIGVIDQAFGGRLLALEENYRRWIDSARKSSGYPTMFADIQWLTDEIIRRRSQSTDASE